MMNNHMLELVLGYLEISSTEEISPLFLNLASENICVKGKRQSQYLPKYYKIGS